MSTVLRKKRGEHRSTKNLSPWPCRRAWGTARSTSKLRPAPARPRSVCPAAAIRPSSSLAPRSHSWAPRRPAALSPGLRDRVGCPFLFDILLGPSSSRATQGPQSCNARHGGSPTSRKSTTAQHEAGRGLGLVSEPQYLGGVGGPKESMHRAWPPGRAAARDKHVSAESSALEKSIRGHC